MNKVIIISAVFSGKINGQKNTALQVFNVLKENFNVLKINREYRGHTFHPTQKPTELIEYLIKTFTNENDVVLDNTAGSLSTAISCLNTNRNFIVMELNSEYFNKGVEEINKWTKKEEINIRTKEILNF